MDESPKMFLSQEELVELTGYKRRAAQTEWLAIHGYKFLMNNKGRAIVLRSYVEFLLGGNEHEKKMRQKKPVEPNWEAARS